MALVCRGASAGTGLTERREFIATAVGAGVSLAGLPLPMGFVDPPAPYSPLPAPRQLAWHELEFYGFLHFTVNTFTNREWGYGDESAAVFNPTEFDADQIVDAAKGGGMNGLILTCKHHDGFCLWPSRYTEHSVKNSPFGRDVVKEISEACARAGVKFGVYLSPWDRNHKAYGSTEYLVYYRNQLRELLTDYGPVFEIFFDGANGGDGYYGGAYERREIDNRTYYDWPNTWQIVRDLQPNTVLFSDAGPDIRWVGNENGIAGETCWATSNRDDFSPGNADVARLNRGDRPGTHWVPAECDVSIRPGWFYHKHEDNQVKTPQQLVDLHYKSIGRGASFLLNLPPDRRGRIHENDVRSLREFRRIIDGTFGTSLAAGARVSASNSRGAGRARRFAPGNVLDGSRITYWATDDEVRTPDLTLDLRREVSFNVVRLREHLPLGQRVEAVGLDQWQSGHWVEFGTATSIGNCRLIRGPRITTSRVRLRVTQASVCPAISEVGLFLEPNST